MVKTRLIFNLVFNSTYVHLSGIHLHMTFHNIANCIGKVPSFRLSIVTVKLSSEIACAVGFTIQDYHSTANVFQRITV